MGDRIEAHPTALDAAGRAAAGRAASLRDVQGASGAALDRLAGELAGARSAAQVAAVRRTAAAVLRDLAADLDTLGRLLVEAAAGYAAAEAAATAESGPPLPALPPGAPSGSPR